MIRVGTVMVALGSLTLLVCERILEGWGRESHIHEEALTFIEDIYCSFCAVFLFFGTVELFSGFCDVSIPGRAISRKPGDILLILQL
jgi:hypothetical protein